MSITVPYALGPYAKPLLGPAWAEFGLALILLLARIYTSWRITDNVKLDLYLAILTFSLASISLAFFTIAVCYGFGQHTSHLTLGQSIVAMRWSWCFTGVSLFAISFGKLTVIAFLQQLHGPNSRYRAIFLWALGFSNFAINAITVGMALASCSPMAKLWNITLHGNCNGILRNEYCAYFQGSWNAMADLILAMYPITVLYRLQLQSVLKVGLCALMGLGVIACACAIVKTIKLQSLSNIDDITYYKARLDFWNLTEMWVILIVACIPPIRKLLVGIMNKVGSTIGSKQGTHERSSIELRSGGARNRRSIHTMHQQEQGNESEENILGNDANIRKTTNIDVEYWRTEEPLDKDEHHDPTNLMKLRSHAM